MADQRDIRHINRIDSLHSDALQAGSMEHLTYTITRVVREWEQWHLARSDGMQLVRESWPCEFDLADDIKPAIEPVGFTSEAQADRFVTLFKAGVPIHDIDYGLHSATGVSSLKWLPPVPFGSEA